MKKTLLCVLGVLFTFSAVFAKEESKSSADVSSAVPVVQEGTITSFEKYGHAVLDISINNFMAAGYELGDTVDIVFGNGFTFTGIPFYNGYYTAKGEPMVRAYPGHEFIAVCINYGKVSEVAKLTVGDTVKISLNTKAAALETQLLNSLKYTNGRSDYASDAVFANFRAIKAGKIGKNILYRSCSPINNEHKRAKYADALAKEAGIKAVLNLADSDEEITGYIAKDDFASEYYKNLFENGGVIALNMSVDFSSESFAKSLVAGLIRLTSLNGPYLIHCTEGKDRAGFASALLEAFMGASYKEIVADYMESYANYYGVSKKSDVKRYDVIVKNNIDGMLRVIAGVDKDANLKKVSLASGAKAYLAKNGMSEAQIKTLASLLK